MQIHLTTVQKVGPHLLIELRARTEERCLIRHTLVGMSFWTARTGPHWDGDARGDGKDRCIGEVVCPDCQNVMARVLEGKDGVGLRAWIPARSVGDPNGRDAGWECYTAITDVHPADQDGSVLSCWRGHGGLWIDGAACRRMVQLYRQSGRKVRQAAGRAPDDAV